MAQKRKQHSVALAAVQCSKTISELASQFGVYPTMITQWKKRLVESAAEMFETNRSPGKFGAEQKRETELYEQIGRLQMELAWLKKKTAVFD